MEKFRSVVRSLTIGSCLLLRHEHPIVTASTSSPASSTAPTREASIEVARYATLPPTVFAPGGRLHGVERVAREALSSSDDEDVSSCGVLALRCGSRGDRGEFVVMAGIGAISPFLHRDEAYVPPPGSDAAPYLPLEMHDPASIGGSTPISVLSPTLVVGTGGRAIDARILLRRAQEVALSLYAQENGGVDWFVSASLEGTKAPAPAGGAAGVDATAVARRVADMAQSSTQSLGGKYGRMLSSSLLAVGARCAPSNHLEDPTNDGPDRDALILWRVDPTGQFWRADAAAVGRGAAHVEAELLRRVRKWRTDQRTSQHREVDGAEREDDVRLDEVRGFLGTLSAEEAVEVARDCLVDGILTKWRARQRQSLVNNGKADVEKQLEQGLRQRIQAVVTRSSNEDDSGPSKQYVEIF